MLVVPLCGTLARPSTSNSCKVIISPKWVVARIRGNHRRESAKCHDERGREKTTKTMPPGTNNRPHQLWSPDPKRLDKGPAPMAHESSIYSAYVMYVGARMRGGSGRRRRRTLIPDE
ncbi:hypothetical protein RSAG8_07977, partial [Rhizoctonia solani AG-8 WAC10335]